MTTGSSICRRESAEFLINQRQQFIYGIFVTAFNGRQDSRNVTHCGIIARRLDECLHVNPCQGFELVATNTLLRGRLEWGKRIRRLTNNVLLIWRANGRPSRRYRIEPDTVATCEFFRRVRQPF
jgi:hypothetical protein